MNEHDIQNQIRLAISKENLGVAFRANVGQAWTGDNYSWHGDVLTLFSARPFSTGLPRGFSDLFGVTPEGRAFFIEVKTPTGRPTKEQLNFLEVMKGCGAIAGVCRSTEEVLLLLRNP